VTVLEEYPDEGVKNNVFGTLTIAEASIEYEADEFVLISTDKAVNPTSVMGIAKRIAEMLMQDFNYRGVTKFIAVRFGNVLGSRGSVIPLFNERIKRGGPVVVRDPEAERYFMSISEAVLLVLQAGAISEGG